MNAKIYTTPICPQCEKAKQFLDEKGVTYDVIDASEHPEIFKRAGHKMVPIIEIGETLLIGFNKKKIEDALK